MAWALTAQDKLPPTPDAASLEAFLFPSDETQLTKSLDVLVEMNGLGGMVEIGVKLGPANADRTATLVKEAAFRESYRDFANYLDLYGPCQKRNAGAAEGWWSSYGEYSGEAHCREVVKLIAATMLWNQLFYCRTLVTGEAKPRVPVENDPGPPYRLDQPPVKTHWLKTEALYEVAGRAVALKFHETLLRRAVALGTSSRKLKTAFEAAASELNAATPSSELVALAIAMATVRHYEATHLDHLRDLKNRPAESGKP